jgi:hypothetical protein
MWIVLSLGCALILTSKICYAQIATSTATGSITDSSGAAVPNVKVTITSKSTGFTRSVVTNASGEYEIRDLLPATYDITVEAAGFKRAMAQNVELYVGRTTTQDFRLEVGQIIQEVTVKSVAPLLTTTSGQLGNIITGTAVTQLPLNGRNYMQLNLLSAGTIVDKNSDTTNDVSISPSAATFSVNGHMSDYDLYMMDGVSIKEFQHGAGLFDPSVEAIQEFQTTTSNYSADYGTEAAAQVNVTTKSGTNQLHGGGWEFVRNNIFDSRDFFQVGGVPPFRRNQFGANIGGPVVFPKIYNGKDKTFFFFNYEDYRQVKKVPETGFYPTPAELGGDLSDIVPNGQLINPFTGTPFSGSIIPTSMIRPATLEGFLNTGIGKGPWLPTPNIPGGYPAWNVLGYNYFLDTNYNYFDGQYITRIDQKITDRTNIYGHFAIDKARRLDPNNTPTWTNFETISDYTIAGHVSHVFSPTLVFDTAVGLAHFMQNLVQTTAFKNNISIAILGMQGVDALPAGWGAPVWNVSGYSNLGEVHYGPRSWWVNTFDLRPTFTWTKGKHTLKWGMDVERINESFPEVFRSNGIFGYTGWASGNALGDFLLGIPLSANGSPDPFSPNVYNSNLGPYVQDDWKVTPKLTLNLGLRYVWVGIPLSDNGRSISNIYYPPNAGIPELVIANDAHAIKFEGVQESLFTGVPFVRAGSVGLPEQLAFNSNRDFEPRIGFAYRLPSNSVVRGGIGIFHAVDIYDRWVEASVDPPFVRSTTVFVDAANLATFNPLNPFEAGSSSAAQIFGNDVHNRLAVSYEANLTLEKTWRNTLYSIAYVGNLTEHGPDLEDPNAAAYNMPGSFASRTPWPTFGNIAEADQNGIGNYNGLQLHAQHTFSQGFTFLGSYTYSRTLGNYGGTYVGEGQRSGWEMDQINKTSAYGLADQHVGQRFTLSYVYELPFGRGKRWLGSSSGVSNTFLGGWQINGITTANTGTPINAYQNFNIDNGDAGSNRPDEIGPVPLSHSRPRGQQVAEFFNTSSFVTQTLSNGSGTYRFGNAGRNTIIGPGTYDWDFALYKNFSIKERGQLQLRGEFYNLFNRAIFGQPNTTSDTFGFGALTYTSVDPREIQLALRLTF